MKRTCLILIMFFCIDLYAGPTLIRDNRVTDIGITPVLGRGYSVATNTYQSTCLKDVQMTEPSYDMEYNFESDESSLKQSQQSTASDQAKAAVSVRVANSRRYLNQSGGFDWAVSNASKSTMENGVEYFYHRVFVTINIYTYYASVDESKSPMSDTAKQLLTDNDLPGFFNSCGAYYVRSIGRKATFLSIFTYSTTSSTRDATFESALKTEIQGFYSGEYNRGRNKDKVDVNVEASWAQERKNKFHQEASSKRLTIVTHAYGLGKDEKASLVSYDLDTFKAAIKDAFISMQNPNTGKVTSVEVVPWVENTEFQSAVLLEGKDVQVKDAAEGETEKVLLYEKKNLLTQNAEFLIEVERADRNLMNMYYKAKLCKEHIDANWKTAGKLLPEYQEAMLKNNRNGAEQPLKQLDALLTDAKIKQLLEAEKTFMYGSKRNESRTEGNRTEAKAKAEGASACVRGIMKSGFFNKSYRDIKECEPVYEKMGDVQDDFIGDYCMPVLAP